MSHPLQVAIEAARGAIQALPSTDEPLQRMTERGIDRCKYDAALPIREKLLPIADLLDPFSATDQSARFNEIPRPVVNSIVGSLDQIEDIPEQMRTKCQRQT